DHLTIKTRRPKESSDDFLVKPESIRDDHRNLFEIHSLGKVTKEGQGVLVVPFADDCRRPKSRPHLDHGEDPDWRFLASDDRFDFVCLKLCDGEPIYFSIVEATTPGGCSFKPAMNRIPGNSLDPSDSRFAHALDAQSRDFIKSGAPVLESIIGQPGRRAECLPTSSALVATTLSPPSPIETMTDNASCRGFSRPRASPVWTAETLHRSRTLWTVVLKASN